MRGPTRANDNSFGFENVQIAGTNVEADGPANTVVLALIHQEMGDHDAVIDLVSRFFRGLGDDRLVTFAVDHDLPFAFALVTPVLRVTHQRKTPFLKLVNGRVNVARHVIGKVFTHHPHQIVTRIAYVIFGLVFVPLHAHVAVDRVKTLRNGTTAVDVGFFRHHDLHVATPVSGFVGSTCAAHASPDDENVAIFKNGFKAHQ